jgi:hypothetical protein
MVDFIFNLSMVKDMMVAFLFVSDVFEEIVIDRATSKLSDLEVEIKLLQKELEVLTEEEVQEKERVSAKEKELVDSMVQLRVYFVFVTFEELWFCR